MTAIIDLWGDLPDPRDPNTPQEAKCQVYVPESSLKHLISEHVVQPKEPWTELFPAALLKDLALLGQSQINEAERQVMLQQVAQKLGQQARLCLERPLVLLYRCSSVSISSGKEYSTWQLVLPCGATLILRLVRGKPMVVTGFFPRIACRGKPEQRWRKVVSQLVARFAVPRPEVGMVPPGPTEGRYSSGTARLVRDIRFVTLTSWGFCPELQETPWRGRLLPWKEQPPTKPKTRLRLRPRRHMEGYSHDVHTTI